MIPIYELEKKDGLESILVNTSLGILSEPILYIPEESEKTKFDRLRTVADANPNQFDLYYLKSVLVSIGWNKNDDVFPYIDTWNARNTPVDKPFNYMHDCKDIIGHITSSLVVSDNKIIDGNTPLDDVPEIFDVIVGSVLYRTWSNKELQDRMDKIIDEVKEGKWKVSMECLFSNFDYAIISPDGKNTFIKRSESSAFLTKHLRVYGGTGEYEGYKVGRLLRSFIFSGKGLVDKPANPKSDVIGYSDKNETKIFVGAVEAHINNLQKEEINMSDTVKEQCDSLKEELDTIKAKLTEKDTDLQKKLSELGSTMASLETEKATVQDRDKQIEDLSKKFEEVQAKYDGVQAELNAIKAEAVKTARLARILERDVDETRAKSLLEKFASVSDEMFNELVEALPAKSEVEEEEEDASEDDVASAEEVVDHIDNATIEPTGSSASVDTEGNLLKSVANWVSGTLRSTAGLKKE